jgi:FlaA1/EpsC-like NDP-sugar epimerase
MNERQWPSQARRQFGTHATRLDSDGTCGAIRHADDEIGDSTMPDHALKQVCTSELLGRPEQIAHGRAATDLIRSSTVLVTGAGGSIGSELVRQVAAIGARHIYMLDQSENSLHALQLELTGAGLLDDDHVVLADIRDGSTLCQLFDRIQPDVVFHAAANKHLPLLERHPGEALKTNVVGTMNVIEATLRCGASHFVNISTDKAAKPSSMLGASKRLAELLAAGAASETTRVASVRFGNVLGSRGSFLDSLRWQISTGQSVTITDPRVTRFFMTIPEAAGLVIEAAAMASRGETFVLDMGQPVRIVDLVDRFVTLSGADAPQIAHTGLRPGEKVHEVLYDERERRSQTAHAKIWSIENQQRIDSTYLRQQLQTMMTQLDAGDLATVKRSLMDLCSADVIALPDAYVPAPRELASA